MVGPMSGLDLTVAMHSDHHIAHDTTPPPHPSCPPAGNRKPSPHLPTPPDALTNPQNTIYHCITAYYHTTQPLTACKSAISSHHLLLNSYSSPCQNLLNTYWSRRRLVVVYLLKSICRARHTCATAMYAVHAPPLTRREHGIRNRPEEAAAWVHRWPFGSEQTVRQ